MSRLHNLVGKRVSHHIQSSLPSDVSEEGCSNRDTESEASRRATSNVRLRHVTARAVLAALMTVTLGLSPLTEGAAAYAQTNKEVERVAETSDTPTTAVLTQSQDQASTQEVPSNDSKETTSPTASNATTSNESASATTDIRPSSSSQEGEPSVQAGSDKQNDQPSSSEEPTSSDTPKTRLARAAEEGLTGENLIAIGDFVYNKETKSIVLYTGSSTSVSVPATLNDNGTDYVVEAIAEDAFNPSKTNVTLTALTLPEGLKRIERNAFVDNDIAILSIPASVTEIGEYAFASNNLKGDDDHAGLTIASSSKLTTIGNYAFSNAELTSIDLSQVTTLTSLGDSAFAENNASTISLPSGLETIGSKAFEKNRLSEVTIPASVTNIGTGAFYGNGRYVILSGTSSAITNDVAKGSFGSVVSPVSVWVKGIDANTERVIFSTREIAFDPYTDKPLDQLQLKGNTVSLPAPQVEGYVAEGDIEQTLNEATIASNTESNPFVVRYTPGSTNPIFDGLNVLEIIVNTPPSEVNVLEGVTAQSASGEDLTDRIVATPSTVDTSHEGKTTITLSVVDDAGYRATATRVVQVVADPMTVETGNGWVMGDFTYDGDKITGLSESGREKAKTNSDIVLPSYNPAYVEGTKTHAPIKSIGSAAFEGLNLTSVTLPEGITEIESSAFSNNELTSITIPDTVTTIGASAFQNNQLGSVELPSSLTHIQASAFENNQISAVALPEGLQEIGASAFRNNNISDVDFPSSLQTLGDDAFRQNQIVEVKIPDTLTSLGSYVFAENKIETATLPSNITSIPAGLFKDNLLTAIEIPETVTTIGESAFEKNRLKDLVIPNAVTQIDNHAFANNYELETLTIDKDQSQLQTIGERAFFSNGLKMAELAFPQTLTSIGNDAFSGEYRNAGSIRIQNVVIPDSVTEIGTNAFRKIGLEQVTIPSNLTVLKSGVFADNKLTQVDLPSTLTEIQSSAFYRNGLTEVDIPEGVTSIGNYAFESNQLTRVALPSTLTSIGYAAFRYNKLSEVVLPDAIRTIGGYAFSQNQISEVNLPEGLETIDDGAFSNNQIERVHLPESLTLLKLYAFSHNRIHEVEFNHTLTSLENNVFSSNSLTSVDIPDNIRTIGPSAFASNLLNEVTIPETVTSIGADAFLNNNLTSVDLPDNLTALGSSAFKNNVLTSIEIPAGVRDLGPYVFANNKLTEVTFVPNSSLQTIAEGTFKDNKLTEVEVPPTIRRIQPSAFDTNAGFDPYKESRELGAKPHVRLLMKDADGTYVNPNNVTPSSNSTWSLNTTTVRVNHVLEGTNDPIADPETKVVPLGLSYTYEPTSSETQNQYYSPVEPNPTPLTVDSPALDGTSALTVHYRHNNSLNPNALQVDLTHGDRGNIAEMPYGIKNYNNTTSTSSEAMPLVISLRSSGDKLNLPQPWVSIDLNSPVQGGHINPSRVVWPNNINDIASEYKIEGGRVLIHLRESITANYERQIPLSLYFDGPRDTPKYFTLNLTGKTAVSLEENGPALAKSDPSNVIALRNLRSYTYLNKNSTDQTYSYIPSSNLVVKDGVKYAPQENAPALGWYMFMGSMRNITNGIITDTIPTYTGIDAEGNVRNDLKAVFVPELSPGWELSEDGTTATLNTDSFNSGSSDIDYTYSALESNPIYFRFPGMRINSYVVNRASGSFAAADREGAVSDPSDFDPETSYGKEPRYRANASNGSGVYYERQTSTPSVDQIREPYVTITKRNNALYGRYDSWAGAASTRKVKGSNSINYSYNGTVQGWYYNSYIYSGNYGHYMDVFFDTLEERQTEFPWAFKITTSNTARIRNTVVKDTNLDPRMRITGIQLPQGVSHGTITFYAGSNADGAVLYQGDIFQDRFEVPESISNLAHSFKLEMPDTVVAAGSDTIDLIGFVYTKLRNPDEPVFNPEGTDSYGRSSANEFSNTVSMSATVGREDIERERTASATERIAVLPYEASIGIEKTLNGTAQARGADQEVSFNLTTSYGRPDGFDINNFKIVDVLPRFATPSSVEFTDKFLRAAQNPSYRFVENVNNSDTDPRWGIVITADKYNPTGNGSSSGFVQGRDHVATVTIRTDPNVENDNYTNTVWLGAQGQGLKPKGGPATDAPEGFFGENDAVTKSQADYSVLLAKGYKAYKFIKSDDNASATWSSRGTSLRGGERFSYKMTTVNSLSSAIESVNYLDILPYNQDSRIVRNESGTYVSRGTDLGTREVDGVITPNRAVMRGPVNLGDSAQNFEAYYTTVDPQTLKGQDPTATLNNVSLWVAESAVTDWSAVTAYKITSKEGHQAIAGDSTIEFTVPMVAPENPDYLLDGMVAVNSFATNRSADDPMVEGNNVWFRMKSGVGTLDITKYGVEYQNSTAGTPRAEEDPASGDPEPTKSLLEGAQFRLWIIYNQQKDGDAPHHDITLPNGTTQTVLDQAVNYADGDHNGAPGTDPVAGEEIRTTDSFGKVQFSNLRYNRDYLLEEVNAPEGYSIVEGKPNQNKYRVILGNDLRHAPLDGFRDTKLSIVAENDKDVVVPPEEPKTYNLRFYKVDLNKKPISRVIYDLKGTDAQGRVFSYRAVSSATGLVSFTGLPDLGEIDPAQGVGSPWTLTEVNPRGALKATPPVVVNFKETAEDALPENLAENTYERDALGRPTQVVSFAPANINGNTYTMETLFNKYSDLNIYKLGITRTSLRHTDPVDLPSTAGVRLSGVTLQLQNEAGEVLETVQTNGVGRAHFTDLVAEQTYYIAEPNAPEGWTRYDGTEDGRIKVRVTATGAVVLGDSLSKRTYAVMPNYSAEVTNRVDILKTDGPGGTGNPLPGAQFGLYQITTDATGAEVATQVQTTTSDENGIATFKDFGVRTEGGNKVLEVGTYEVRELSAPVGYANISEPYRFNTDDDETIYLQKEMFNPLIKLKVSKWDAQTGQPLAGATFSLYESQDGTGSVLETATSGADGVASFTYNKFDPTKQYSIRETGVPAGYTELSPNKVYVVDVAGAIAQSGFTGTISLNIDNRPKVGDLVVSKRDELSLGTPVAGAVFELTDPEGVEAPRSAQTGSNGRALFTGLTPGKTYTLTETAAPAGYATVPSRSVTVGTDASTFVSVTEPRSSVTLNLTKVGRVGTGDDTTDYPLAHAKFTLRQLFNGTLPLNNETVKESDENGLVTFENLKQGATYLLTEDTSRATSTTEPGAWKGWNDDSWIVKVAPNALGPAFPAEVTITSRNTADVPSEVEKADDGSFKLVNKRVAPASGSVSVTKAFRGGEAFKNTGTFEMTLSRTNAEGVTTEVAKKTLTAADANAPLTAKFTDLDFDYWDATAHKYVKWTYSLSEAVSNVEGGSFAATYSTNNFTLDVQNQTHAVAVDVTNTYTPATPTITATKTWKGGAATKPTIYFALNRALGDADPVRVPASEAPIKQLTSGTESVSWDNLPSTDASGNAYTYTVQEVDANGLDFVPDHYVKVESGLTVTNTYQASGVPVIQVAKTLNGEAANKAPDGSAFTFTLKDSTGTAVETVQADKNGVATFNTTQKLKFNESQFGETYTYTIEEDPGTAGGVTYDTKVHTVAITVVDPGNGDGSITFNYVYDGSDDGVTPVIENSYTPNPAKVVLRAGKTLVGRSLANTDAFTFRLEPAVVDGTLPGPLSLADVTSDETEAASGDVVSDTNEGTSNDAARNASEDASAARVAREAVVAAHTAEMEEGDEEEEGTDDSDTEETTPSIDEGTTPDSGNNNGGSDASNNGEEGSEEGEVVPPASNNGDGEVQPHPGYLNTVATKENITPSFPELTFTEPGTYAYRITEEIPDQKAPGMTYDSHASIVIVTVTDDHNGGLHATVAYRNDTATTETDRGFTDRAGFTNVQNHVTSKFNLPVNKLLTGRALKANEFSFELRDENDQVVAEATNDADGTVTFPAIEFEGVGTYAYTLHEVKGNVPRVTYDTSVYDLVATVKASAENSEQLVATWSAQLANEAVNEVTFKNAYKHPKLPTPTPPEPTPEPNPPVPPVPPVPPTPGPNPPLPPEPNPGPNPPTPYNGSGYGNGLEWLPKTGDGSLIIPLALGGMTVGLVAVVVLLFVRKRKEDQ